MREEEGIGNEKTRKSVKAMQGKERTKKGEEGKD